MSSKAPLTEIKATELFEKVQKMQYAALPNWVQKELEEQKRLKDYAQYLLESMYEITN